LGNELYNLMRTEFGEVEEPFSKGKIGSSTMPHKRNPASIEGLASLTRPIFHAASLVHESLMMEHERDAMSWRAEWIAIPELCQYLSCQFALARKILGGLVVKPDRMLRNLNMMGGLIVSERVMFVLGEKIGKQTAHHLVYELSMEAEETGTAFADLLASNETVRQYLDQDEIAELLNPEHYTGSSTEKAEDVLRHFREAGIVSQEEL
jgi:adenylosuccinate lyase